MIFLLWFVSDNAQLQMLCGKLTCTRCVITVTWGISHRPQPMAMRRQVSRTAGGLIAKGCLYVLQVQCP